MTSLRRTLVLVATACAVAAGLYLTSAGVSLESHLARPVELNIRDRLAESPQLHPNLKVYALDDQAVARLGISEPSTDDWAKIINTLAKSDPRLIIIDKKFGILGESGPATERLREALSGAPVAVGGFAKRHRISWDTPLSAKRSEFDLLKLTGGQLEKADWLPQRRDIPYGPHPSIRDTVTRVGHLNYAGDGRVAPFIRLDPTSAMPHLGLIAASGLRVEADGVYLSDKRIPLDREGRIPVNWPSRRKLYQNTHSLLPVITRARSGRSMTTVDSNDTVVILPYHYTGNVDMTDSQIGRIPAGYVLVSIINSALTGEWLAPVDYGLSLVILSCLLGATLALTLSPLGFWVTTAGVTGILLIGALALFTYEGWIVPWLPCLIGYYTAGFLISVERMFVKERQSKALENALSGLVSDKAMKDLKHQPERVPDSASEQLVTVMFLDIVGFSTLAERSAPESVFNQLKETLGRFSNIIHEHGGIVDKSLGDGLLCFFGYSFSPHESVENHADAAVRCALQIQESQLQAYLANEHQDQKNMPVRIGLNTARVFVGNLGNDRRIDFTVIGDGVNFAQRLEAACEPYTVNVSEACYDFSTILRESAEGVTKRRIKIKHHQDLFTVYEVNPFHNDPQRVSAAIESYRETSRLERRFTRWPVKDPRQLVVHTDIGRGTILDFSRNGMSLRLGQYLAGGFIVTLELDTPNGSLAPVLAKNGLETIQARVRWGRPDGETFIHGLELQNLDTHQLDTLYKALRSELSPAVSAA